MDENFWILFNSCTGLKKGFWDFHASGENRDNSMLPDFHNFRVVLIIVLLIIPILMKIESWNFVHVVDMFIFYKIKIVLNQ